MTDSVHGHAVLDVLAASPEPMSRESLREAAARLWGADRRYHTCSASDMSLDDLVEFLLVRRKISEQEHTLIVHPEERCSHD